MLVRMERRAYLCEQNDVNYEIQNDNFPPLIIYYL